MRACHLVVAADVRGLLATEIKQLAAEGAWGILCNVDFDKRRPRISV